MREEARKSVTRKSLIHQRIPWWKKHSVVNPDDCWIWQRALTPNGYAQASYQSKMQRLHKLVWEFFNGPVPEGLELDHLCRNRSCWNPEHLEPVTHQVNMQRGDSWWRNKTHCPLGHEYSPENTYTYPTGNRSCRICRRVTNRERKRRIRETTNGMD